MTLGSELNIDPKFLLFMGQLVVGACQVMIVLQFGQDSFA